MPIKLDCPRCKTPLAVPSKRAGSYVNCPHCDGQFWVPEQKKTGPGAPGSASTRSGNGGQSPSPSPAPSAPVSPAPMSPAPMASAPSPLAPTPPTPLRQPPAPTVNAPPVQAPVPGRKVARFVSAEAAQSTLQVSEDGQLPELQLQEGEKKKKQQARERTVSPAVLFGVLSVSAVLCLWMALDSTGPQDDADTRAKHEARANIQKNHFADAGVGADPEHAPPLKPYQRLLREAQLAHERKDYRTEGQKYREVLDLLRQERGTIGDTPGRRFESLTDSVADDKELEDWIRTLLKED